MKSIKTLIRLQKKALDERARKKAEYETHIIQLQANINALQDELEHEQQLAASMPEMAFMFRQYAENNKKRQDGIKQTLAHIQKQLHMLEEEIKVHFGELKKYEIVLDQMMKKQAREEKRREDKILNDIATNKHVRKEE